MGGIIQLTPYGVTLIMGTILAFLLSFHGFNKKHDRRYLIMALFAITVAIEMLGEAGEVVFVPVNLKILFSNIGGITYALIPLFCILFILDFAHIRSVFENKKLMFIVAIIPVLAFFGGITNPWLHLVWTTSYQYMDGRYVLIYSRGALQLIYYAYSLAIIFIGSGALIHLIKTKSMIVKTPIYLLILGLVSYCVAMALRLSGMVIVNPLAFVNILYLLIFTYLLVNYQGLDFLTLVHETFLNNIDVCMLFFDKNHKLTGLNPACEIINLSKDDIGKKIEEISIDEVLTDFYYSNQYKKTYHYESKDLWLDFDKKELNNKNINGMVVSVFNVSDIKTTEELANKRKQDSVDINKELNRFNKKLRKSNNELDKANLKLKNSNENLNNINQELEKSNNANEILLKEIHHRVKNNLQIILSLLNLDKRFYSNDPDEIIDATANRIKTMALIHEKTYKSDDLVNVDVENFIRDSVDNLASLYGEQIGLEKIDYDLNHYSLNMESITPIGLILNELFINTVKYAYEDYDIDDKIITVKFNVIDNVATLIFADNGKGLPEDINIHNSPSLGLTIVNSLTEQLSGEFSKLDNIDGAGFKIVFPIGGDL